MKKMYFGAKKARSPVWKLVLPVLLFLAVAMLVMAGIQNISGTAEEERLSIMKQAVVRSAVQCYAIEGRYPEDIAYLEEHYGLVLDREHYLYHYERIGSNLMPEIAVFVVDG